MSIASELTDLNSKSAQVADVRAQQTYADKKNQTLKGPRGAAVPIC